MYKKPLFARFDLTTFCNLKCKFCYASDKTIADIDTKKVFLIIDKLFAYGIRYIRFGGGEPFLKKDLSKIVKYSSEKGIDCDIITNGTLIRTDDIQWIKKYIKNLSISLDSHIQTKNDELRGEGVFNKVIQTIKLLNENKISFNIISTLNKKTLSLAEDFLTFSKDLGVEHHYFSNFIPLGRGKAFKNLVVPEEVFINKMKNLKPHYKHLLVDEKYNKKHCGAGKKFLNIINNGDITLCAKKYSRKYIIGNIFKDSLKTLWANSPLLKKARITQNYSCINCRI